MTTVVTDLTAAWKYPASPMVYGVAAYIRRSGDDSWKFLGKYTATSFQIPDLDVGTKYDFAFAYIDRDGKINIDDLTVVSKVPGGTSIAPPAPTNFAVGQSGKTLKATWDSSRKNVKWWSHYELRKGATWVGGRLIAKITSTEEHSWLWETSGSQTYMLAAVDSFGRRSSTVSSTVVVQALGNYVTGTTVDEDGTGFTGTKVDTEVDSGNLQIDPWADTIDDATDIIDTATWLVDGKRSGTYETAETDLGSIRAVRLELDLVAASTVWNPVIDDCLYEIEPPVDEDDGTAIDVTDEDVAVDYGSRVIDGDERPVELKVEIKFDDTTPIATSYQPFIPGDYSCRYHRFRVTLYAWDRHRLVKVSKLRFYERKKNLKDEGTFSVSGVGPHAVTFVQSFIDEPYVDARHSTGTNWVKVENITVSGFDGTVYDDDGNEVTTGSIYWTGLGT